MSKLAIRVALKCVSPTAVLPAYQSTGSAGLDLCADIEAEQALAPMERRLIPTGIAIALPVGLEAQVRPRSGLSLKHGISVLNSPGTIDSDYRGELKVLLINFGPVPYVVKPQSRIAQLVIAPVVAVAWNVVDTLDETGRGDGGYGSTGG